MCASDVIAGLHRILLSIMLLVTGVLLWPWRTPSSAAAAPSSPGDQGARPAPDFPTRDPALWINSPPLSMADLRGRVVLIDVWTYG